jgi:hypothetical protein
MLSVACAAAALCTLTVTAAHASSGCGAESDGDETAAGVGALPSAERAADEEEHLHYAPSPATEGPLRSSEADLLDPELALMPTLGRDPNEAIERAQDPGRRGEFVFAPIPMSNPTFGSGLILVGGYIFPLNKEDKVSPPSVIGGGAMRTSNDSEGWGLATTLYFDENRHRMWGAYLDYDVRYDFYGIGQDAGDRGISIPLTQSGDYTMVTYLRRLRPDLYGGLSYRLNRTQVGIDFEELGLTPPEGPIWDLIKDLLSAETASLGLMLQQDRRDNTFAPTRGTLIDFAVHSYDEAWGSDVDYRVYELAYNSYRTVSEGRVLAFRFYARATDGNVPFWGLCQFGARGDLRGYVAGQYRDRVMAATQLEYRVRLNGRVGLVVFAGVGEVAPKFPDFTFDDLLPSAGVGVRYQISKEHPVNYRIDYAIGKEGGELYFAVGEAF